MAGLASQAWPLGMLPKTMLRKQPGEEAVAATKHLMLSFVCSQEPAYSWLPPQPVQMLLAAWGTQPCSHSRLQSKSDAFGTTFPWENWCLGMLFPHVCHLQLKVLSWWPWEVESIPQASNTKFSTSHLGTAGLPEWEISTTLQRVNNSHICVKCPLCTWALIIFLVLSLPTEEPRPWACC